MRTKILFSALEFLYVAFVAAVVIRAASALLPQGLNPVAGMLLGMVGGMALSCVLGFLAAPLLGMFETMYLGCFAGMPAGMLGAMAAPGLELSDGILFSLLIGAVAWTVHLLLNSFYRKRSY